MADVIEITSPTDAKLKAYFKDWWDSDLETRREVLQNIANGWNEPFEEGNIFQTITFRRGYDPINHYEDNLVLLLREVERRSSP